MVIWWGWLDCFSSSKWKYLACLGACFGGKMGWIDKIRCLKNVVYFPVPGSCETKLGCSYISVCDYATLSLLDMELTCQSEALQKREAFILKTLHESFLLQFTWLINHLTVMWQTSICSIVWIRELTYCFKFLCHLCLATGKVSRFLLCVFKPWFPYVTL